jgi:hypothetical protein
MVAAWKAERETRSTTSHDFRTCSDCNRYEKRMPKPANQRDTVRLRLAMIRLLDCDE